MSDLQLFGVRGSELFPMPVPSGAVDLHDLFAGIPPGIYSALRTFAGDRFLRLDAHLDRCRRCVARAGWHTAFDYDGLCTALDRVVRGGTRDVRVRFDLLREPWSGPVPSVSVVLGIGPHADVPEAILRDGARLGLAPAELARNEPLIKFTEWVERRAVCQKSDPGAYEYLLLDAERRVLEGTSSNFYALRANTLVTAADGVLEGITRQITLELAREHGLLVELRRMPLDEVAQSDEAFITSSTRGIVPVTHVGEERIGTGFVGPVVPALRGHYEAYASAHAQRVNA
jgi:branched-subunit amino acid aminotransferase/4-amino-4-deoxychorismate lyase